MTQPLKQACAELHQQRGAREEQDCGQSPADVSNRKLLGL